MFEQIPEFKKEKLEEEVSLEKKEATFEDFDKKESALQKEAEGFLMNLVPEKFKKKAVGLLAAFSIFTASSSAFAEGFKGEEINKEKLLPPEQSDIIKSEDKDNIAPFDWKKIADKVEISIGGQFEKKTEFRTEKISDFSDYRKIVKSDFYRGISEQELSEALWTGISSVAQAKNSQEFFASLSEEKDKLSNNQKALILQYLGKTLGQTYNYDMLEADRYVEVSNDAMFASLKDLIGKGKITESAMCGGIHTYLVKIAGSLGVEAWLQNGSVKDGGGHVWSGIILDDDKGKKQIVFLDYETLLPTGTMNYQDALGIAERYHRSVKFTSFVGDEKEVLLPVKSRAEKVAERASGIEEVSERLEEELSGGELKKERGLEIKLSPEIKEIKLNKGSFGLAYFNFEDSLNNPYQSLEDLSALQGSLNFESERLGVEMSATVLHMNIKDLYGGSVVDEEVVIRLAADYIDSHKFTKAEYGQFALNFGAVLQSALRLPLRKGENVFTGAMSEAGSGVRLVYIDPTETGKFYIGASETFRGQIDDFQNQNLIIKEVSKTLTVGAEIKVNEAQILNLEAVGSELDWGKKLEIKGGLEGAEWKGAVEYEKATSEYERFVPSSEKISAEVGYRGGPKWEVDVIGSKTTEKYKDADGEDVYGAEVKLKIFLW